MDNIENKTTQITIDEYYSNKGRYTSIHTGTVPVFDNIETWFVEPNYSGYSVGYGMETVIGPVEIKHSWSPETKDHHTWFSVGFWF